MRGRVCVGIRTHLYGPAEERLLGRLAAHFGPDALYLVVDETRQKVEVPPGVNKVALDRPFLESEGLYTDHPKVGWLCGDYFLYALRQQVPADQYWLIEPDVHFGAEALPALFESAGASEADLLVAEFEKAKPGWAWYRHGQQVAGEVYRCFFPVVRVSGPAIDHLRAERRRLSDEVPRRPQLRRLWPNDESFVATALGNGPFRCEDLLRLPGLDFASFNFNRPVPLSHALQAPPNAVMHPVLDQEAFQRKVRQVVESAVARSELDVLARHFNAVCAGGDREQVESIVLGTVSDWLTRRLREPLTPPEGTATGAPLPQGPVTFGGLPAGLTVRAKAVKPPRDSAFSAIADFELSVEPVEPPPPGRRFAPYQIDPATGSFLFVDAPRKALEEAFFYQSQRKFGRLARRVPLDACATGEPEDNHSTFVFSIGRCGSTLFSRIAAVSGYTSISECDVFMGIPRLAAEADRRRALACSVEALRAFCNVPSERLVLKFRSQSSSMAALTRRVFPQARYFMLLRDLEPWSRSFIQKFDWKPEQLSTTLMGAIHAVAAFRKAGGTIHVLAYEQFARHPEVLWEALNPGVAPTEAQVEELRQVSATDSQEGSGIGTIVGAQDVDRRVEAFLAHWQKVRPAEQISALGLKL